MELWQLFLTVFGSILGGGAIFSFIQFLIKRKDDKANKNDKLIVEIQSIKTDIEGLRYEINEDRATNARIRILQFSDDLRLGVSRSKESFDQAHLDIDSYKAYCGAHKEYENSKAVAAIKYIETKYQEYLERDGFLD